MQPGAKEDRITPKTDADRFCRCQAKLKPASDGRFRKSRFVGVVNLKKCLLFFGAALLTAGVAAAADGAMAEAFLGYNSVLFNPSTSIPGTSLPSFSLYGGDAQLVFHFHRDIGLVLDVGSVHAGGLFNIANSVSANSGVDHNLTNFVLGPRYTAHWHKRLMPFAQILFGGARATSSTSVQLNQGGAVWPPPGLVVPPGTVQPVDATLRAERTGFAMLVGGGIDIKITKHVAFRPLGADYYLARLPNFVTGDDTNKNHFRYSAGVNFLFGAR
jgi:hypothetical protein